MSLGVSYFVIKKIQFNSIQFNIVRQAKHNNTIIPKV